MKQVHPHLPQKYIEGPDSLVKSGMYPNRAEAIRFAIRDLLLTEVWIWNKEAQP